LADFDNIWQATLLRDWT